MAKWFWPYVYRPSETADYFIVATPFGVMRMNWGLLIQISAAICIGTIGIFGLLTRWKRKEVKKTKDIDSALKDNIKRKGENSYYYAHRSRNSVDCEQEIGSRKKVSITKYSWVDQKDSIKIYLDYDKTAQDMKIDLTWTPKSFSLSFLKSASDNDEYEECLVVKKLYSNISNATWKLKKSVVLVSLIKAHEGSWKSLHAAARHYDKNVVYDDSLYD